MRRSTAIASIALLYAAGATAAAPVIHWAWANPKPSGANFQVVAFGGGVYVAAGSDGTLYSSPDGSTWTPRSDGLGVGASSVDILYQGGRFVLTGIDAAGASHVAMSGSGLTWTDQVLDLPAGKYVTGIAYGDGTWLLAGDVTLTSTDAQSWTRHDLPADLVLSQPVSANGVFVAMVGLSNDLEYSRDGATWQPVPISHPAGVLFDAGMLSSNGSEFVFTGVDDSGTCGNDCTLVYTSSDGANWTLHPEPGLPFFKFHLFWDGSRYLTFSNGPVMITSTDGFTWSPDSGVVSNETLPAFSTTVHSLAIATGHYVAVGDAPLKLSRSADFTTWTSAFAGASGPTDSLLAIDQLNGKFFATGVGATEDILESDDGFNWSEVYSAPAPSQSAMSHVAFGNGMYVVVDGSGTVLLSSDGSHWSPDATPPSDHLSAVVFGNGVFEASCAPSCFGKVYTSPDGATWTAQDLSALTTEPVQAAAFTGSRFVALSPNFPCCGVITSGTDLILTSTDGMTWSPVSVTLPTAIVFSGPKWANGRLVMFGFNNLSQAEYFQSSSDGLHWSGGALNDAPGALLNPNYDGSYYYATGNGAGLYISSDGLDWSLLSQQPFALSPLGLLFEGSMVYAVGGGGDILVGEAGGPAAVAGSVQTKQGKDVKGTLAVSGAGGKTLSYSIVAIPAHGHVTLTGASYTYTPDSGFAGVDSFAFAVSDGQVVTKAAVTITVTGSGTSGGGGGGAFGLLLLAGLLGLAACRKR